MARFHCVACGEWLPEEEIGITGRCRKCWEKELEGHDLRMRTIIYRQTGELISPGKYAEARAWPKGEGGRPI